MDDSFLFTLLSSSVASAEGTSSPNIAALSAHSHLPVSDAGASIGAVNFSQAHSAGLMQPSSGGIPGTVYPDPNGNNPPPPETLSANAFAPLAVPCGLAGHAPCSQPLYGTSGSIREHLRMHGYKHHERQIIRCPWAGCSKRLRWMNIPRHIQSVHLHVRIACPQCGKRFTRSLGLRKHIASQKCFELCVQ